MFKRLFVILALVLALAGAGAKTKALNFENPGNRRLLKNDQGNYYYFRSLPEKSMTLNVEGISSVELRSFAIEKLRKPQVVTLIGKERTTHDLTLKEQLDGFSLYNSVSIAIPKGTKTIEVLCYECSIYFRAFHKIADPPKPKPSKPANKVIRAHGGIMTVSHNGTDSEYYVFNPSQSLKFTLNNGREGVVYVRARLLDRSIPSFEVWANGNLIGTYEFSLKRTTKYKAVGITYLSTGMKIELPDNSGATEYEFRAVSDHLFLGRPVLIAKP